MRPFIPDEYDLVNGDNMNLKLVSRCLPEDGGCYSDILAKNLGKELPLYDATLSYSAKMEMINFVMLFAGFLGLNLRYDIELTETYSVMGSVELYRTGLFRLLPRTVVTTNPDAKLKCEFGSSRGSISFNLLISMLCYHTYVIFL